MASQASPAVEYNGAAVGAVRFHVVVENMVAPECLAETVGIGACEILLPVEPPEVYTLFFERAQEVVGESLVESLVLKFPGNDLCGVGI